jgi:hypothetical protein
MKFIVMYNIDFRYVVGISLLLPLLDRLQRTCMLLLSWLKMMMMRIWGVKETVRVKAKVLVMREVRMMNRNGRGQLSLLTLSHKRELLNHPKQLLQAHHLGYLEYPQALLLEFPHL